MIPDRLARDNFIETLVKIIDRLCESKQGCTFAINGKWGSGKSFVLELFRERILQRICSGGAGAPYYVFRYNCWQYDYYEEPAVAIVSALHDEIKDVTDQFYQFKNASHNVKALSRMAIEIAKKLTGNFLNSFIPFDIMKLLEEFQKAREDIITEEQSDKWYDQYFSFKDAIKALAGALKALSEEKPVILLIDELDRCAPTYAVKVLERIHHIFNEQQTDKNQNIIVILAIDQAHLEQSIRTVYGIDDSQSISDYLKKFITFSLALDLGHLSQKEFWEKYQNYLEFFDTDDNEFYSGVESLPRLLFRGIDIRTQEKLMDRITLLHKLSFSGAEKVSTAFLYFELLHQVLLYYSNISHCENWEARIVNPENDSELRRTLNKDMNSLITSLERKSYTSKVNVQAPNFRPRFVKPLKHSSLACAFALFALIAHNKAGTPNSLYPYRLQDGSYPIDIGNGLPDEIKLFIEFSEQMEFW